MSSSAHEPNPTADRIDLFANVALGIGLLLPQAAAMNNMGDAYQAGRFLGISAVAVLVVLVVLKAVLKSHPPLHMAFGKLVLAVLVVLAGLKQVHSAQRDMQAMRDAGRQMMATLNDKEDAGPAVAPAVSEEARKVVAFLNGVKAMVKRQAAQSELLNKEFQKIDMSTVLTPAGLTTRAAIEASRAKLGSFGDLVDQRDALFAASMAEAQQYMRTVDVPEQHRAGAVDIAERTGRQTLALNAELSAVQRNMIKHMTAMLAFSASQLGKTKLQQDTMLFAGQRELDTFRKLSDLITRTAAREEAVIATFNAHVQQLKNNAQKVFKPV